jgi:general L-amino acid transport system permease protein
MSDIASEASIAFVRNEPARPLPPPVSQTGALAWLRENLFGTVGNSAITIIFLVLVAWVVAGLFDWAIARAVWTGEDREACLGPEVGACWAYVREKFLSFMYGRYPFDERWRVNLTGLLFLAGFVPMLIPRVPYKRETVIYLLVVFPITAFILLTGGNFDIPIGLYVTALLVGGAIISFVAMAAAAEDGGGLRLIIPAALAIALIALVSSLFVDADTVSSFVAELLRWPELGDHDLLTTIGLACAVVAVAASLASILLTPGYRGLRTVAWTCAGVAIALLLLALIGLDVGLEPVRTERWGGLMLTLVVALVGITGSLPIGILLALGRRSKMPIVRYFSIGFIELWRGVPMVTVLFMANVMLPLFLPPGTNFDRLLRALVGVTMFSSAYMAEIVRGGLQAIPRGQYEAAAAIGLSYWQMMRLIILPQALKIVIPGIVNTFIGLFKDTTLVVFVGLFDLLGMVQVSLDDQNWATPHTAATGFVFAAMIYWCFCFGMSRYSMFMERRLSTGHKR